MGVEMQFLSGNCFLHTGHLEMVRFLLEAGADQEHKTDEMHTALMEACMVRDIRLEQSGLWALFSSQRWRKWFLLVSFWYRILLGCFGSLVYLMAS